MSNFVALRQALVARILNGAGSTSRQLRQAAFDAAGLPEPLNSLVGKVAAHADTVTDDDIAVTRASGLSEEEIFEIVISAAVGQAARQDEAARSALSAAIAEE